MTVARYNVSPIEMVAEARFELAGNSVEADAVLNAAGLPVPSSARAITKRGNVRVAWVGPRRWLVSAPMSSAKEIDAALSRAIPQPSSFIAADVTGSVVTFLLQGRSIEDVLAQGIAHDLSLASFPAEVMLATEGWGVGLLLERDGASVRVTVDNALAAYVSNCLRTASGQASEVLPGVMRAPPPAIIVSR